MYVVGILSVVGVLNVVGALAVVSAMDIVGNWVLWVMWVLWVGGWFVVYYYCNYQQFCSIITSCTSHSPACCSQAGTSPLTDSNYYVVCVLVCVC